MDISDINVSSGNFYQALIGGDILRGLHARRAASLGLAVIHMPGYSMPGYISWMQPKSGCVAYAKMLAPTTGGVNPVTTMTKMPPPPPEKSATIESNGVCLSKENKKQLRV